ncbi:MAG: hypothetical protein EOS45_29795 [Mesorhizobium sp.]|nr:hypothetical protein EN779_15070 [Mesorhizobium sp. M4B.F.Ca.ET.088.02.2.1]RWF25839.1 MAG: hypothetical protein EOS45_29795 [Mesorhizobium sp.]TIX43426.1 MAG: hypothetical protein E5V40_03275 [Mesorhizobium sp.]
MRTYLPCRSCIGTAKGSIKVGDEVAITATVRKRVTEDRVAVLIPSSVPLPGERRPVCTRRLPFLCWANFAGSRLLQSPPQRCDRRGPS